MSEYILNSYNEGQFLVLETTIKGERFQWRYNGISIDKAKTHFNKYLQEQLLIKNQIIELKDKIEDYQFAIAQAGKKAKSCQNKIEALKELLK